MKMDSPQQRLAASFSNDIMHHDINSKIVESGRPFDTLSDRQRSRRYPSRLLRYFVPFHWLGREAVRQARPLKVCEIGIGSGSMLRYLTYGLDMLDIPYSDVIERWVGVDVKLRHDCLDNLPYDDLVQADLENDVAKIPVDCDVCILLHVIEHLRRPEDAIETLFKRLPKDCLLIVGFPQHPHFALRMREPYIRAYTKSNGHVSAISNRRFNNAALANGCAIEEVRGAYFLRASGLFLENYRWWQKFNLAWGRMFSSWPGESFIAARKLTAPEIVDSQWEPKEACA